MRYFIWSKATALEDLHASLCDTGLKDESLGAAGSEATTKTIIFKTKFVL